MIPGHEPGAVPGCIPNGFVRDMVWPIAQDST